jgi:hypothetical protein
VGQAFGERQLRRTRNVFEPQLFHHGLPLAVHGFEAEIEQTAILVLPLASSRKTWSTRGKSASSGLRWCVLRWPRWMCIRRRSEACELRYEPRRTTMHNARSSSLENALFKTKAQAKERIALITEFSSSYMKE